MILQKVIGLVPQNRIQSSGLTRCQPAPAQSSSAVDASAATGKCCLGGAADVTSLSGLPRAQQQDDSYCFSNHVCPSSPVLSKGQTIAQALFSFS